MMILSSWRYLLETRVEHFELDERTIWSDNINNLGLDLFVWLLAKWCVSSCIGRGEHFGILQERKRGLDVGMLDGLREVDMMAFVSLYSFFFP